MGAPAPARGPRLRPVRLRALALFLLPSLLGCGKRGDPQPPRRRIPAPVTGLSLAQRGARIEIAFQAPGASTDGARLPALDVEMLVAQGDGDFEKLAARRTRRAQPGQAVVETVPVPAPSTTVRVAVRARAGSRSSVRTPVAGLVVHVPPAAPRSLTAELVPQGVALAWKGPRPEPVKAALPTPAPAGPVALSPAAGSVGTAAASGPASATVAPGAAAAQAPAVAPPFPGGFSIYRRSADGVYARPLGAPVEGKAFTDTTAPLGQEICYQVRAVASLEPVVESDPTDEACVRVRDVAAPGPPTGVTVLPAGDGLELSWSPSPEPDLAGYRVLRASAGGPAQSLAEVAPNQTQYIDTSAARGVAYSYRLVALDQAGNVSPPSDPAEGILP